MTNFKPYEKPTIYKLISGNNIAISFFEQRPDIFFIGMPQMGISTQISIEEIPEIMNVLSAITTYKKE